MDSIPEKAKREPKAKRKRRPTDTLPGGCSILIVIIILVVFGFVILQFFGNSTYDAANAAYAEGHYERAIELYSEAILANDTHIESYIDRGYAYLALELYENAISDFQSAIALDGDVRFYSRPYIGLGMVYTDQGRSDDAIENFTEGIEVSLSNSATPEYGYYNRGLVYLDIGKYDLAAADFQQVIDYDREFTDAYWALGNAYYEAESYKQAMAAYRQYQELAGNDAAEIVNERVEEMKS